MAACSASSPALPSRASRTFDATTAGATESPVNASCQDFERGARFLAQAEATYPGWLARLLTYPVKGLENYAQLMQTLTSATGAIKVYCEVAPLS